MEDKDDLKGKTVFEESKITDQRNSKVDLKLESYTDLDDFAETFDKWQSFTSGLLKQNDQQKETIDKLVSNITKHEHKIEEQNKEITQLHETLNVLHIQLNCLCDLEDENRNLKSEAQEKELQLKTLHNSNQEESLENQRKIEEMCRANEEEMAKIENEARERMETEAKSLNDIIGEKCNTIDMLEAQLEDKVKENEANMVKMSLEYENKLTKLRQRIPPAGKNQNSANQEIFRMKLQNLKTEYEGEIKNLKATIQQLEDRLGSYASGNRVFSSSTRQKRKF